MPPMGVVGRRVRILCHSCFHDLFTAAGPGQGPGRVRHQHMRSERGGRRAEGTEHGPYGEDPPSPEEITERAGDEHQAGGGQEAAGDHPLQGTTAAARVGGDTRKRDARAGHGHRNDQVAEEHGPQGQRGPDAPPDPGGAPAPDGAPAWSSLCDAPTRVKYNVHCNE
ncbi:hypothetical protein GCM10009549_05210 [Streptomyces thermoalcalitolerans]|uniref:Uncharacterized protein n=1 Tax=Streptomyces thermoalcalitolerans TaxID=65605 RepID=A0ABN1NEB7_9ACTN